MRQFGTLPIRALTSRHLDAGLGAMKTIKQLSEDVSSAFAGRSKRMNFATVFVKTLLIGAGTALVGVAQFAQVPRGQNLNAWQGAGIVGCIIVLLGALFMIFTEDDPTKELTLARSAVERARELETVAADLAAYKDEVDRSAELYFAFGLMRGVLERTIADGAPVSASDIARALLAVAGRHLAIAMGFNMADEWTLSIYEAVPSSTGGEELACVASKRAIECDISKTRRWPSGIGVAGICYAGGFERIVPDMWAPGIGNLYTATIRQSYDQKRYRSVAAVPISVGRGRRPWGVVIGTSAVQHHFVETESGLESAEGARALAAMMALGVAIASKGSPPPGRKAPQSPTGPGSAPVQE